MNHQLKNDVIARFGTDYDKTVYDYPVSVHKSSLKHLPSFLSPYFVLNNADSEINLFSKAYKVGEYILFLKTPELFQELREKYFGYEVCKWTCTKGMKKHYSFKTLGVADSDFDSETNRLEIYNIYDSYITQKYNKLYGDSYDLESLAKMVESKKVKPENFTMNALIQESEELNFLPIGTYVELDKRAFDPDDNGDFNYYGYISNYLKDSKPLTGVILGYKLLQSYIAYSILLLHSSESLNIIVEVSIDMVKPLNLMPKGVVTEDCETGTPRMIVDVLQSPDSEIQYKTLSLSNPHEIKSFQAQDLKMVEFPVEGSIVKKKNHPKFEHTFANLAGRTMVVLQTMRTLFVEVAVLPDKEDQNLRFLEVPLYLLEVVGRYTEDFNHKPLNPNP